MSSIEMAIILLAVGNIVGLLAAYQAGYNKARTEAKREAAQYISEE